MTGRTVTFTVTLALKNNESEAYISDNDLWSEFYHKVNDWWVKTYNWPSPVEIDGFDAEIDTATDY